MYTAMEKPPPYMRYDTAPVAGARPSLLDGVPYASASGNTFIHTLGNPGPFQEQSHHSRFLYETEEPTDLTSFRNALEHEFPPLYTAFEDKVQTLTYHHPYIIATSANGTTYPRYHVRVEHTKSGKPFRLQIRRLLKHESRRLSSAFVRRDSAVETCDFDSDMALYLVENVSGLDFLSRSSSMEIRGRQNRTLPGYISLDIGRSGARFWHITPNAKGDALREENERKMQKFGYKPKNEINKVLLFSIAGKFVSKDVEWRDVDGNVVAKERVGGDLNFTADVSSQMRDILITCWLTKNWAAGTLQLIPDEGLSLTLSRSLSETLTNSP